MSGKKNSRNLCLAVDTSRIILGSSSRGNAGHDGDLRGGTGASVAWLTWSCARAGSVQWVPAGTLRSRSAGRAQGRPGISGLRAKLAGSHVKPIAEQARGFSPGKPLWRNGRKRQSAGGARRPRHVTSTLGGTASRPASRLRLSARDAFFEKARAETQRGKGETCAKERVTGSRRYHSTAICIRRGVAYI
jgi:hypothetical protein